MIVMKSTIILSMLPVNTWYTVQSLLRSTNILSLYLIQEWLKIYKKNKNSYVTSQQKIPISPNHNHCPSRLLTSQTIFLQFVYGTDYACMEDWLWNIYRNIFRRNLFLHQIPIIMRLYIESYPLCIRERITLDICHFIIVVITGSLLVMPILITMLI